MTSIGAVKPFPEASRQKLDHQTIAGRSGRADSTCEIEAMEREAEEKQRRWGTKQRATTSSTPTTVCSQKSAPPSAPDSPTITALPVLRRIEPIGSTKPRQTFSAF